VVVSDSSVLGVGEDPDRVLRSPGRLAMFAAAAFLAGIGVVFVVAGAFAPLGDGESRSWVPIAAGAWFMAFGIAAFGVLKMPRRRRAGVTLPAASTAPRDGQVGVELPLRASARTAAVSSAFIAAALGLIIVAAADGVGFVVLGAAITLVMGALGVLGLRGHAEPIRLSPEGLALPGAANPHPYVPWSDVHEVAVTGGWLPHLVVSYKGPGLATARLLNQAWPPSAIVEVVEYFRTRPADRPTLTEATVLNQFRS
jgi:hypothetical protein